MILNSGLDNACTNDASSGSGSTGSETYPYFCRFITYAAFGTGSTAPDPTDTTLDAQEGARTQDRGGFSNTVTAGLDSDTNTIWYESTFTRVFNIGSNANATEWGLSPASTGNLSVRELFRADPLDPNSSPITLTLEDGDQLQLIVTLRVQAAWEYETKSFVITGTAGNDTNGTHEGKATVSTGTGSSETNIRDALVSAWPKGYLSGGRLGSIAAYDTDKSAVNKNQNLGSVTSSAPIAEEDYIPGSHYRDWTATFGTGDANFNHYAWAVSQGTASERAYRFILTDPPFLTKTSTHRLTLTVRKSISRL